MANLQSNKLLSQLDLLSVNPGSVFNWIVNTEGERLSLPVLGSDLYKLCLVKDVCKQFVLLSSEPIVWGELSAAENGLSAYEIAVKHGFIGTEEDWLEHVYGQVQKDDTIFKALQLVESIRLIDNSEAYSIDIPVDPTKSSRFVIRCHRATTTPMGGDTIYLHINDDFDPANYVYYLRYHNNECNAATVVNTEPGIVIQDASSVPNTGTYTDLTLVLEPGRHPFAFGTRLQEALSWNNVIQSLHYKKADPVQKMSLVIPEFTGILNLDIYEEKEFGLYTNKTATSMPISHISTSQAVAPNRTVIVNAPCDVELEAGNNAKYTIVHNTVSGSIMVLPSIGTISGKVSHELKNSGDAIEVVCDGNNFYITSQSYA